MKLGILLEWLLVALVILLLFVLYVRAEQKQAYVICEGRCLLSVKLSPKAKLIAPMKDGHPDYSRAVIQGIVVDVNHSLEKVELR